jgi:hypothetical protein
VSSPTTEAVPGAWAGPAAMGLFLAGVATAVRTARSPYPRPGAASDVVQEYFQGSAGPARVSVAGQLASAAALVPFADAVARLAAPLPRGTALARTARVAGLGAATTLTASALMAAALTAAPGRDPDTAIRLHRRAFVVGGPLHAGTLGVLMGVLAVAGQQTGRLPRSVVLVAAASAVAGLAAPLYLVDQRVVLLVPAGRFSALVVAAVGGAALTRTGP